jgi:hypothetical protein
MTFGLLIETQTSTAQRTADILMVGSPRIRDWLGLFTGESRLSLKFLLRTTKTLGKKKARRKAGGGKGCHDAAVRKGNPGARILPRDSQ